MHNHAHFVCREFVYTYSKNHPPKPAKFAVRQIMQMRRRKSSPSRAKSRKISVQAFPPGKRMYINISEKKPLQSARKYGTIIIVIYVMKGR